MNREKRALNLELRARSNARNAIGDDLVVRAATLSDLASAAPHWSIPLNDRRVLEDTKHDWLTRPVAELHGRLDRLGAFPYDDDARVGRRLRAEVVQLVETAEAVAELLEFLLRFDSEIARLLASVAEQTLLAGQSLVRAITAVDEQDFAEARGLLDRCWSDLDATYEPIVFGLPHVPPDELGLVEYTHDEEVELLVGVPSDSSMRWYDRCTELEESGVSLCSLASHQLGHLGSFETVTRAWSQDYLEHAVRLGSSPYPLLAHRSAVLTTRLLESAIEVDARATYELIVAFYATEAPWIISSAEPFNDALGQYLANDDRPKIVSAYLELTEGVARRFGSLLIALRAVANHAPEPQPLICPTIGPVIDGLTHAEHPACDLVLEFLEGRLRNARAHANVAVGGSGELTVRLEDGSTAIAIADEVFGKTVGLRSALDGIDTAINVLHLREIVDVVELAPGTLESIVATEALLSAYARLIARDVTRGEVGRILARDGEITVSFSGEPAYDELEAFTQHLAHMLVMHGHPEPTHVHFTDENGQPIGTFTRNDLVSGS